MELLAAMDSLVAELESSMIKGGECPLRTCSSILWVKLFLVIGSETEFLR